MRRHLIPHTNLDASVLCLGTAEFGSVVEDSVSEAIIDCYIDAGGNVLDTAEVYAAWVPGGSHRSEEFLGRWLRKRKSRDGLILSTKGAHPRLDSMDKPRMSKKEVESDLNSSLQRLGVDHVDLYWLHRDDPGTPAEEILLMLEEFRKAGKIRYAGFSNWTQARAEEARLAAAKAGRCRFHRQVKINGAWRKRIPPKVIQPGPTSMIRLPNGMPFTALQLFLTLLKQTGISGDWITAASLRPPIS